MPYTFIRREPVSNLDLEKVFPDLGICFPQSPQTTTGSHNYHFFQSYSQLTSISCFITHQSSLHRRYYFRHNKSVAAYITTESNANHNKSTDKFLISLVLFVSAYSVPSPGTSYMIKK